MADEEMRLGVREIYVHYGAGMARSKLKIPAAKHGTARNMNTIAKIVSMISALLPAQKSCRPCENGATSLSVVLERTRDGVSADFTDEIICIAA